MAGIRSVYSWVCTCGVRQKVVAEVDANPNKAQTAVVTCPHCGHEEHIFANQIVSVTQEKVIG
jgi:hypothetical protein